MKKRWPENEAELAAEVVTWLRDLKWDVYQEVGTGLGEGIADIVAVQGSVSWIIETKTSISLALLEQAYNWRRHANYVSIAVPSVRRVKGHWFANQALRSFGIGKLIVSRPYGDNNIHEEYCPSLSRTGLLDIRKNLVDQQKTWAKAGNNNGKRWSPFQQTCENLVRFVSKNEGCLLKEAIEGVDHHYRTSATARGCVARWIREGVIGNIEMRKEGRSARLYLARSGDDR